MTDSYRSGMASLMLVAISIAGCADIRFHYAATLNTAQLTGLVTKSGQPVLADFFTRFYRITRITNDGDTDIEFKAKCVIPKNCVGADVPNQVTQWIIKLPGGEVYTDPTWSALVRAGQTITPNIAIAFHCPVPKVRTSFDPLHYATEEDIAEYPHLPQECGELDVDAIDPYKGLSPQPVPYLSTVDAANLP